MSRHHLSLVIAFAISTAACSDSKESAAADTAGTPRPVDADVRRDAPLLSADPKAAPKARPAATAPVAPTGAAPRTPALAAPRPSAPALTARSLDVGVAISASIQDELSSRTNKPDEIVRAVTSANVNDWNGKLVIPAGSPIALRIVKLEPGSDQVRPEGRLELAVVSVVVNGTTYPLTATLGPIPHTMKGRGITTDEAARVAAGTAVGAAIGQIIGKNTKGTVIGGAVGAVAGGAAAARYAYRDIIVAPGTAVTITLTGPFETR